MKKVLSLFSGCGGMDLGFEGNFDVFAEEINPYIHPDWVYQKCGRWIRLPKTSFQTIFANDIRSEAQAAWINYFSKRIPLPDNIYYLESIVNLVKKHEEGRMCIFPSDVDVVTGGFPCQDFSIAGKRRGFHSNRSHEGKILTQEDQEASIETRGRLYIWMRNVISICKPKVFIAENVKGLVDLSDVKMIIEHDFRDAADKGYLVVPARVLMAADYGIPQSRQRVIFIGFRKSSLRKEALDALNSQNIPLEYDPYPVKTHSAEKNGLLRHVATKTVLLDLDEPDRSMDKSQKKYSKAKYMGQHCQGQIEINLDGIGPTIRSEHHGNIEFRRLSTEHGGKYISELSNGLLERRLTVRECARIQTFPDDYEFVFRNGYNGTQLSASAAYKLIGNAVPPLLAYHLAKRLEENWNKYFREDIE